MLASGALLLFTFLIFNGAFMLVSPRRWFKLPAWLRASGSLTEAQYSSVWGAVQVRLTGAAFIAFTTWMLYHFVS